MRIAIEYKNTVIKVNDMYFCYGIFYSSPFKHDSGKGIVIGIFKTKFFK